MPTFSDIITFLGGQIFGQMPVPNANLSGRLFIVTGANTGLGFECVKHLVRLNASCIILACRDVTKGEAAVNAIQGERLGGTDLQVWHLDLVSYDSTISFAQRAMSELPRLDGIVASAGVEVDKFELASDLELTIKVNVVSTFLLAAAILPKLLETSKIHKVDATLTIVGSLIHAFGPDSQLDVAKGENIFEVLSQPKLADMGQRYLLSKLMSHQCARQLAQRVLSAKEQPDKLGVIVNWVNPGWCQTELSRSKAKSLPETMLMPLMGWTAEKGSRSLVFGVIAGVETHGCYLSENQVKQESTYLRSNKGREDGARIWHDLVAVLKGTSAEAARIMDSL